MRTVLEQILELNKILPKLDKQYAPSVFLSDYFLYEEINSIFVEEGRWTGPGLAGITKITPRSVVVYFESDGRERYGYTRDKTAGEIVATLKNGACEIKLRNLTPNLRRDEEWQASILSAAVRLLCEEVPEYKIKEYEGELDVEFPGWSSMR